MIAVVYVDENQDHIFKLYHLNITKSFYDSGSDSPVQEGSWSFSRSNDLRVDYSITPLNHTEVNLGPLEQTLTRKTKMVQVKIYLYGNNRTSTMHEVFYIEGTIRLDQVTIRKS